MWSGILTTFLIILGGLLLMGLPGALILTLTQPALSLILGKPAFRTLPGDNYWPFALALSVLFPLMIVPGYGLCVALLGQSAPYIKWGIYIFSLYLWAVLLALLLFRHFATLKLRLKTVRIDPHLGRGQAHCLDILPGASLSIENPRNKISVLATASTGTQDVLSLSPLDAQSLHVKDNEPVEVLFSRQYLYPEKILSGK